MERAHRDRHLGYDHLGSGPGPAIPRHVAGRPGSRCRAEGPTDLRKSLGEILDAASAGEQILIERDHRPLAYLVSVEDGRRLDGEEERIVRSLAALDRLEELRQQIARGYSQPDDGLTDAEWLQQERERRTDRIDEAASSGGGAAARTEKSD